jgi:hypothetical protein
MDTPAQMCARLVAALEDLSAQELASLEARDFEAAIAVQDRAAPLLEHLVAHWPEVPEPQLKARMLEIIQRRNRTGEWLAEQVTQARQQLEEMQVTQRRVARVAPAYGRGVLPARRQLCQVG